ncbi:MAG: alginate export family protein [Bacteroidota bacterium]|nr:alginate export family protein [Bacteroidota bacterium]
MKIKILKLFLLTITIALSNIEVFSQFSINAEMRPRYEFRNGYKTLPTSSTSAANVITQRTRLNFESQMENLDFKLSLQDVRTWGDVKVKDDLASSFINEAWAELKLNPQFTIKLGRQKLKYDDQRLFTVANWNNVSISHDLALLKYENNTFKSHVGFAYNNEKEKNFESFYPLGYYKTLTFVWLSKEMNDHLTISFIDILDGNQKENTDHTIYGRNTFGPNIYYNIPSADLRLSGNFYYQHGKEATGKDVNAYFYSLKAAKKFSNLGVDLGFDYYSGTDGLDTTNTEINTFNKLYGAGHRFNGHMDYFTDPYSQTQNGGLSDLYINIKFAVNEKLNIGTTLHYLSLANNVIDPNYTGSGLKAIDKHLGTEIDLYFDYQFTPDITLNAGYSLMFAQKSMEVIKGGDADKLGNWAFLMLVIKPTLFSN